MRKSLLLAFAFISYSSVFSQSDSLLRYFKFRNANYRAISIGINGSGMLDNTNYSSGKLNQYATAFSASGFFQQSRSTDKQLFNLNAGLSPSFSSTRSDELIDNNKARIVSISPNFSVNNKWYSKKYFLELGAEGFGNFASSRYRQDFNGFTQNLNASSASFAVILGAGKGRLENITDMQNALWLYKSLEDAGCLTHQLSSSELNQLGKTLTKSRNTRILDARRRTQFILETVDSYFQENGLLNKTDIKYFSNLNDIVFFAFNDPRLSGIEKFVRLKPLLERFYRKLEEQPADSRSENEALNYGALLTFGIEKHVPQSLKHQNNFGISVELKQQFRNYTEEDFLAGILQNSLELESAHKQAGLAGFFEHSIYPNTRTIINFKTEAQGGYQDLEGESSHYLSTQLLASWNYFITYRTRINCSIVGQYQKNIYTTSSYSYYLYLIPETFRVFANVGVEINL